MRSAHEIYDKVGVELQSLALIGEKSAELEKIEKVYRNIHKDDLDVMPRGVFIGVFSVFSTYTSEDFSDKFSSSKT